MQPCPRRFPSVACAAFALASAALAQGPSFTPLGHPNGFFTPAGVAADGSVAVGMSYVNPGPFQVPGDFARRWRLGTGFDYPGPAPEPTASWSSGCSANGQVMCGGSGHAVFGDLEGWVRDGNSTAHTGQPSGHDTSDLLGIASNGAIAVGYGGHQSNPNLFQAARYTLATDRWQLLGFLPGGNNSEARACSADGSIVVGWSGDALAQKTAFRWTSAGMAAIPHLPNGDEAFAAAVSADGSVVVGEDYVVAPNWSSTETAFKWTAANGTVSLGLLPGGLFSSAMAVSPDGIYTVGCADDHGNSVAFVHDDVHGMRRLQDVLVAAGLGAWLANWQLTAATAIAGAGPDYWLAVAGVDAASNDAAALVHVVFDAATSVPIGSACGAMPTLQSSLPRLGQSLQCTVGGAAPQTVAASFVSLPPTAPLPIGACTVEIDPSFYFGPLLTPVAGNGTSVCSLAIPGMPALMGLQLVAQTAVLPLSALGFDLTNGLLLTLGH